MICPYQERGGMEPVRGKLVSCRIVSTSLGWWHAFPEEVCQQCLDETDGPLDLDRGRSNTVNQMVRDKLLHALSVRMDDEQFRSVFKLDRDSVLRRAKGIGISASDIANAQKWLATPVKSNGPVRNAPQDPRQAVRNERLKPNTQIHWKDALRAVKERKRRPCVHIDMNAANTRHECACGPVYPCALHKHCVISSRSDLKYRSCLYCKDYVEKVPPKPRVELKVVIGVTTCPVMKTARDKNGRKTATDEVDGWRDTLPATLNAILSTGWSKEDVTIFAEPFSHVPDGWRVVWREKRLGPWWNVYQGMKQLLDEHPDAHQLWVEDDTILSNGLREELNRRGGFPSDKCGILRVFRMSGMGQQWVSADTITENKRSDGYQKVVDKHYLWGSNAILLSNDAIKKVAATDGNYPQGLSCSPDVKLGVLLPKLGFQEWCCNPSLAQTDHRLPSTTGHSVSSRMIADTFIPMADLSVIKVQDKKQPLKIHVVRPNDGWILQEIGSSFVGCTSSDSPSPTADCNVYVNYSLMQGRRTRCDIGYFTHREPDKRGQLFDRIAQQADWCIAMSEKTLALLPEGKRSLLKPSIGSNYLPARDIVIGVCAREYPRKRFGVLDTISSIPGVKLHVTEGRVPKDKMPEWFRSIDYLLVTSDLEGGPVPVLEALAMRKPVIAPDVGWCWEYPVIRYSDDEGLLEIVERLASPVRTWEQQSETLSEICQRAIASVRDRNKIGLGDRYSQLLSLIRERKPRTIVEVGTWNGDRAVQMAQEALRLRPIVHYDGYDLFETASRTTNTTEFNTKPVFSLTTVAAKLEQVKRAYPGFTYTLHRGNTQETLKPASCDFAFIDGGHSLATITHDLNALRESSVVVLDDWYEPDEHGRCPDVSKFGCNRVLNGDPKQILPIAGRVAGGGIVKMVLLEKGG